MNLDKTIKKLLSNSKDEFDEAKRLLIRIADNIIVNPKNRKVRSLQKYNATISKKILDIRGGKDSLFSMGFHEDVNCFVLPEERSTGLVKAFRERLLNVQWEDDILIDKESNIPKGPIKFEGEPIKRAVLPPIDYIYNTPFLRKIEINFYTAQYFGNQDIQKRAKQLIPIKYLENEAQIKFRQLQLDIKLNKVPIIESDLSIQEFLLLELLNWFKEEFFTWVDKPLCEHCKDNTNKFIGMSRNPNDLIYTDRVEVYQCYVCEQLTKFPRFNDLNILLETRRGRCGEWAQVFTLMCYAMGWSARFVVDESDHVWTEVYSFIQKRWIHCDPCENAYDKPLLYECGWSKEMTYVLAYSVDDVQDVTWRYTSDHKATLQRRKNCTEKELIDCIMQLRNERQKNYSNIKRKYLTKRLLRELAELLCERKPQNEENQGRISGSMAWRLQRGEIIKDSLYYWPINPEHLGINPIIIRYSPTVDRYEFICNSAIKISKEWNSGIFSYKNIFKKEENDWKIVYLARMEGTDEANISWKIIINENCNLILNRLFLRFARKTFENGDVKVNLYIDDKCYELQKNKEFLKVDNINGAHTLLIEAILTGGRGDLAWQHAQIFRQCFESCDYPFRIELNFI